MIQILIVEDNSAKRINIKKAILEIANVKEESIVLVPNVKEAKRVLYEEFFDLMILDLVIPIEEGEDASALNGVKFLDTINSNPSIKPPIHIIGLTSYTDKVSEFRDEFNSRLWHLIEYKADSSAWHDKLTSIIYHLVRTRERYVKERITKELYDIAIMTALPSPEFEALLRLNGARWERFQVEDDVTQYYKTTFVNSEKSRTVVAATADQMGMTASSHLATKMILYFRPKYLLLAGITAGIKDKDLGFGDILIAEQSWDYGSGKIVEVRDDDSEGIVDLEFEPDTRDIQLNSELKAKVTSFKLSCGSILDSIQNDWPGDKPKTRLQLHLGPLASGSYVISSAEKLNEIRRQQRKMIGVEMETFGVYYAAAHSSKPDTKAISIKSVCDYASSKKNDKYQKYAAYTSASLLYHFVMTEL